MGSPSIALAEADDAEREKRRAAMGQPYLTLLGHFRHEVGHYYWDRLVRDEGRLDQCRAVFGDDSQNYEQALQQRYAALKRGCPSELAGELRQRFPPEVSGREAAIQEPLASTFLDEWICRTAA